MGVRLLWLSIVVILVFGGYCGRGHLRDYDFDREEEALSLFREAYRVVREHSVYKLGVDKAFDYSLRGMFSSLGDNHSSYLGRKALLMLSEQMEGEFGGVGFAFTRRGDDFVILYTLDGSPARAAGIRSRDVLFSVGGRAVRGLDYFELTNMVRGEPGTDIMITILRNDKKMRFSFRRELIRYNEVEYRLLDDDIAYIKIRQFGNATARYMLAVLKELKGFNIKGIIIDLRGNTGGSLFSCVYIVNYFLSGRRKIVEIRGKDSALREYIFTHHNMAIFPRIPLVILSDGETASASEIFVGVMQDYNRGIVIGGRTYGKGSVQQFIRFNTNGDFGAKLTYARWYTPNARVIDAVGLEPDIEVREPGLNDVEKYYVLKLLREDMVYNYVKEHKDLSQEDIDRFIGIVRSRGFDLSDAVIVRLLKKEKYVYSSDLVIDMDYDIVLGRAFSYIVDKASEGFW